MAATPAIFAVCSWVEINAIFEKFVVDEDFTLTQDFLSVDVKSPHCLYELSPKAYRFPE